MTIILAFSVLEEISHLRALVDWETENNEDKERTKMENVEENSRSVKVQMHHRGEFSFTLENFNAWRAKVGF